MPNSWKYFLGFLALIATTIWCVVLTFPEEKLHLIACDVGQGDAVLALYGKTQILVDGGPNNRVLDCLTKYMPFWDREIEVVILSHPQVDHFKGLIEVFKRYKVNTFIATPINSSTSGYEVLKNAVGGSGAEVINPTTGMVIRFDLLYLDIVWPSSEFLGLKDIDEKNKNVLGVVDTKGDLNDYSVVVNVRLKEFDALLTGDIGQGVTEEIIDIGMIDDVDYIKIPHHGSKNAFNENLLRFSKPEIAVICVGKDNKYGHPHKEVLEMLEDFGLRVLRTDEVGDIEVITDGKGWWVE